MTEQRSSGVGGLLAIPPTYFWGRAPVVFWCALASCCFTLGICVTDSFAVFYAMRALQAATVTIAQVTTLCYIKDMFFLHEHARKIGIWLFSFYVTPYLGPQLGYFMVDGLENTWRSPYWLSFASCVLDLILVICFMDETWYRRDIPAKDQPDRSSRFLRLLGIWQVKNHKNYFVPVLDSFHRLWSVLVKPLVLPILIFL